MGQVVAVIKILPEEAEQFDAMKEKVKATVKVEGFQEEPIAFGLKCLIIQVVVEDGEGGTDKIEESIKAIPEVGDVTVTDVARL